MKKYRLDLSEYEVTVTQNVRDEKSGQIEQKEITETYPLRNNLCSWLRIPGVWQDGIELCDAHDLAKQIKNCSEDTLELDEKEMGLLKKVFNKLISQPEDPVKGVTALGGEVHEECIRRVFKAVEV